MNLLTAREAAEYLHVSLFTLGRIEKEGLLVPFRTPGGHRRYSLEMLKEYLERTRSRDTSGDRKILVVDDTEEVIDRLTDTFSSYRFFKAEDELDVGIKLAELKPDLILVNTGMPGLDPLDLCRRLYGQSEGVKVLPFEAHHNGGSDAEGASLRLAKLRLIEDRIKRILEGRSPGHRPRF